MKVALEQQGKPYVPGKQGPHQFDCSGLVWYSFEAAGVHFPRTSAEVMRRSFHAQAVDPKDLQPGDLLFYWFPNSRGIPEGHAAHVEIYVDSGLTIGADNEREGVRLEPIPYKALIGAARILPPED
ncbi:C40 family peptidase [bacterium]|nr:C40 family peptidase [bacterium]